MIKRLIFVFLLIFVAQAAFGKDTASILRPNEVTRLHEKLKKTPPAWMLSQIERDLAPFSSGITKAMLDHSFYDVPRGPKDNTLVKIRHREDGVWESEGTGSFVPELLAALQQLDELAPLPTPMEFLFYCKEGCKAYCSETAYNALWEPIDDPWLWIGQKGEYDSLAPVFTFARYAEAEKVILMPDYSALFRPKDLSSNYDWKRTLIDEVGVAAFWQPWEQRESKAVWRGATTGGPYTKDNWKKYPRTEAVVLSLERPDLIDARFSKCPQCDIDALEGILKMGGQDWPKNIYEHLNYKYQLLIDGNIATFGGTQWRLLSESCVFKVDSRHLQWFTNALVPYYHYIPVKEDLSDLEAKLTWAQQNDAQVKRIADNAKLFVEENLMPEDGYLYLYHLLWSYDALLKKAVVL